MVFFEDFFGDGNYEVLKSSKNQIINSSERFLILFCFFCNLFNNKGGSIFLENINCNLFIMNSFFNNSSSNYEGGAIYYNCNNGSVVLYSICSNYCFTSSSTDILGQFSYIMISNFNFIFINSLSISKCSPFEGHSSSSIELYNGNETFIYSNSSYNLLYRHSGVDFRFTKCFKLSFSTFINNKVTGWVCLYSRNSLNPSFVTYINVVDNNSFSRGISLCDSLTIYISFCNFLKNIGVSFDIRVSTNVYIFNCFFDSFSTINNSPISYQNNSITIFFTTHKYIYSNCKYEKSKEFLGKVNFSIFINLFTIIF